MDKVPAPVRAATSKRKYVRRTYPPLGEPIGSSADLIQAPLEDALLSAFGPNAEEPRSAVLTGTAGDGKSHLCGRVWAMLNGSTKEWSTDEIYFQLTKSPSEVAR